MSFYAKDDNNCQALLDFIESKSVELLGVKLVFVDKTDTLNIGITAQTTISPPLISSNQTYKNMVPFNLRTSNKIFSKEKSVIMKM
jgi:hypothetical protein